METIALRMCNLSEMNEDEAHFGLCDSPYYSMVGGIQVAGTWCTEDRKAAPRHICTCRSREKVEYEGRGMLPLDITTFVSRFQ